MSSWGSIVARSLAAALSPALVACSTDSRAPAPAEGGPSSGLASANAPVAAPMTATPPGASAAPDVPPASSVGAIGVGALQPLDPTRAASRSTPSAGLRSRARTTSFVVEIASFARRHGTPGCLLANPACLVLTVAHWPEARDTASWLGPDEPPGLGAPGAPLPASAPWFELSGGREVVYAAHRAADGLRVDRVDGSGRSTPWLDERGPSTWRSARVVETAAGSVLVGAVGVGPTERLRVARIVTSGGRASLEGVVDLPFATVEGPRPTAQGARQVQGQGLVPIWAPWAAVPELDDAGEVGEGWSLVVVTVEAPSSRATSPGGGRAAARHRCGSGASRSLSASTVSKRVLRVMFEGVTERARVVVDRPAAYDPAVSPLRVTPLASGALSIDGVVSKRDGSVAGRRVTAARKPASEAPKARPAEVARPRAWFDERSGEGLLVHAFDGEAGARWRRFDAEGRWVGEVSSAMVDVDAPKHRVGEGWVERRAHALRWLTGERAGREVRWLPSDGRGVDLVERGEGRVEVLTRGASGCGLVAIDVVGMKRAGVSATACPKGGRGAPLEGGELTLREGGAGAMICPVVGSCGVPLAVLPATAAIVDGCTRFVRTGERRGVLVCHEATSVIEPGATAGLRAVRF